jgi:hypothetical protein
VHHFATVIFLFSCGFVEGEDCVVKEFEVSLQFVDIQSLQEGNTQGHKRNQERETSHHCVCEQSLPASTTGKEKHKRIHQQEAIKQSIFREALLAVQCSRFSLAVACLSTTWT